MKDKTDIVAGKAGKLVRTQVALHADAHFRLRLNAMVRKTNVGALVSDLAMSLPDNAEAAKVAARK